MGKIASDVFESLFGNLRRGADIDHERHPTLFADLCDGKRAPGINVSDDALGAFVDDALSSDPGLVDIAFGVDMSKLTYGHLEQWSILPRDGAQCCVLFSI